MRVPDALEAAVSTFVSKPASILPFYLLGTATGVAARTVPLVGLVIAYLILSAQGRIDAFAEAVAEFETALSETEGDLGGGPEEVDPEGLPTEEFEAALAELVTLEVVIVVGLSLVLGLVVYVLAEAIVHAGRIHTVYAGLRDDRPIATGVSGTIRDARTFAGLWIVEYGLYLALTAAYGSVVVVAIAAVAAGGGLGALLGLLAAVLAPIWVLSMIVVAAVFVFAPQAVVIDGARLGDGVRRGAGFIRRRPGAFAVYVLIALGVAGAAGTATAVLAILGAPQATSLVSLLLVTPVLHLLKTAIYAEGDRVRAPPLFSADGPGARARLRGGWNEAVGSLWSFTKRTPGLIALSFGLFFLGMAGGYTAVAGIELPIETPDGVAGIFGPFPVDTFVMVAANNWIVAVGQSYAGFALGIPTAVSLLFNGAIVGLVSGLGFEPIALAALIVPHAVIEVPALAVSGALGLHLGRIAWRRVQGRIDDETVAGEVRLAFWVLVGLAVVFVIASFVEAFVTPRIAARVL